MEFYNNINKFNVTFRQCYNPISLLNFDVIKSVYICYLSYKISIIYFILKNCVIDYA